MSGALQEVVERGSMRPMTLNEAIDLWLGDLARRGRAKRTRDSYCRTLDDFADGFPRNWPAEKITAEDCERFLDRFNGPKRRGKGDYSVGTRGQVHAPLNGLFGWLYRTRRLKTNPMEFVPTVSRKRPEDLDVTTISPLDVPTLLREARPWSERNALFILAYMGPRRNAVAGLRLSDFDRREMRLRFHEKGGKTIWKPAPHQLAIVLEASIAGGAMTSEFQPVDEKGVPLDPYLVPPEGELKRADDRDDRVIWRIVRKVSARAGVKAHVHALRGAFACFYLMNNPRDVYGLNQLLGHASLETTKTYLRRYEKDLAMEPVRTLAWMDNAPVPENTEFAGIQFESSAVVGAGGFEPP